MTNGTLKAKERLIKYKSYKFDISQHGAKRCLQRQFSFEELKKIVENEKLLKMAEKQQATHKWEEKYDCYFQIEKNKLNRIVIVFDHKNKIKKIVTALRKDLKLQKRFDKHVGK